LGHFTASASGSHTPASSAARPALAEAFMRNAGPGRSPSRSVQCQFSISCTNTSSACRACSEANTAFAPVPAIIRRNSFAATSGISLASRPALRQKFRNLSRCTLHQYSVFSGGRRPRLSAMRRTQGLGWVA
jgi:hypothetical protein